MGGRECSNRRPAPKDDSQMPSRRREVADCHEVGGAKTSTKFPRTHRKSTIMTEVPGDLSGHDQPRDVNHARNANKNCG